MKQHHLEEITYTLEDMNNKAAILEKYPESLDNEELLQALNDLSIDTKIVHKNILKLKRKVLCENEKIQSSWR